MNNADARAAFELRVDNNFSAAPVAFAGLPFSPPASGGWVRMSLMPNSAKRITLGPGAVYREQGLLIFQIFVPAGEGSNAALVLADGLTSVFFEAQFEHNDSGLISCRVPTLDLVGTTQDGNWFQVNLVTEYQRDVNLA